MTIHAQTELKAPGTQSFSVQDGRDRDADQDEGHPAPRVVERYPDEESRDPGPDGVLEAVHEDSLGEEQHGRYRLAGDLRLVDGEDGPRRVERLLGDAEREAGYRPQEHPHPDVELDRAVLQQNEPGDQDRQGLRDLLVVADGDGGGQGNALSGAGDVRVDVYRDDVDPRQGPDHDSDADLNLQQPDWPGPDQEPEADRPQRRDVKAVRPARR